MGIAPPDALKGATGEFDTLKHHPHFPGGKSGKGGHGKGKKPHRGKAGGKGKKGGKGGGRGGKHGKGRGRHGGGRGRHAQPQHASMGGVAHIKSFVRINAKTGKVEVVREHDRHVAIKG